MGWLLLLFIQSRPLIRLCRYSLTCATLKKGRLAVFFPPRVADRIQGEAVLAECQQDVDVLARWFGVEPGRELNIYLFEREEDVGRLFGSWFGAYAITRANAVLVPVTASFRPLLRHELTHLFATRIGSMLPRLKSEGLAVWFQCDGPPQLGDAARKLIGNGVISMLLNTVRFGCADTWLANYEIAASFTDFLIQRYGWSAYLEFYRSANQWNFPRALRRAFNLTLFEAEALWLRFLEAKV